VGHSAIVHPDLDRRGETGNQRGGAGGESAVARQRPPARGGIEQRAQGGKRSHRPGPRIAKGREEYRGQKRQ
jgi:hypothetical protein